MESIIRMLYNCDERSIQIIEATIKAALKSSQKCKKEPMSMRLFMGSSTL